MFPPPPEHGERRGQTPYLKRMKIYQSVNDIHKNLAKIYLIDFKSLFVIPFRNCARLNRNVENIEQFN